MSTQPDPNGMNIPWSWAVQREADGLSRNIEQRLQDMSNRIDKSVGSAEYAADKRSNDIVIKNMAEKLQSIEKEHERAYAHMEKAIGDEAESRREEHSEYVKSRQSQTRWFISLVLIPIVLGLIPLLTAKH